MYRFYHVRVRSGGSPFGQICSNGGATIRLERIDADPLHVQMYVAYCNPADVFCKRKGRATATAKFPKVVSLRDIPGVFGKVWHTVHHRAHVPYLGAGPNFDHLIREWLPRE